MRGLLLAVALALCAGAAPSQRTIVSLTLNMGGVLCGTSPEDFDATLKTRVPNTNMIPYPYAAIIFQTQEGGYRGQPVEGTAADLVGKVKTALSVPGNFQTITISHDAGFGWIRESWRFLASQTIFYDPSVIDPEGDPLHKFIGKGIKKKRRSTSCCSRCGSSSTMSVWRKRLLKTLSTPRCRMTKRTRAASSTL